MQHPRAYPEDVRDVGSPSDARGLVVCWREAPGTLEALSGEWNDLLTRSEADTVFLTWEWVDTWWRHFGKGQDLWILEIRDGSGRLVGLAPLKRTSVLGRWGRVRRVEFLGYGAAAMPDHLNLILERGLEERGTALVLDALLGRSAEWDLLHLVDVHGDSLTAKSLLAAARARRMRVHVYRNTICPYLPLPDTFEAFLGGLRRNLRREVRAQSRKLEERVGVRYVALDTPETVKDGIEHLARLHQLRMEETERGGNFRNPEYLAFHSEIMHRFARLGWLELKFLETGEKLIAGNYSYRYHGVLYGYQMGLDPEYYRYSPGSVLLSHMIRDLIVEGFREVDMLRGRSAWKYRWTAKDRVHFGYTFPVPGWRGIICYWSDLLGQGRALVLKRVLSPEVFDFLQRRWKRVKGEVGGTSPGARS